MNVEERLRTERISKLLLTFSVPSIISLVITAVYNMVDQIFIGQGVGYLGNGATNVIYPLTQVALALGLMIGEGGANYISLHLGRESGTRYPVPQRHRLPPCWDAVSYLPQSIWRFWNRSVFCSGLRNRRCPMRWIMDGSFPSA